MKIHTSDKLIAWMALLSGLSISTVAVYYSVAGLVAIFAASAIPIMVMGVTLEISKLVATVWLKLNWQRAPALIKTYLMTAIAILMLITSMGIFGYLSKAHLDQAVPTGDIAAQVSLIDTKIQTQKDNIEAAKAALKQMDGQVNEMLARSTDNKGTERAVQIRRQQAGERTKLQKEIETANVTIGKLNEERAPIAKDLRKVEAEVGPIKYIAALLYGDNPDSNLLEKAVRWVIIVIVMVFDPLAVILLLASQYSFQWFRQEDDDEDKPKSINDIVPQPQELVVDEPQIPVTPAAAVTQEELDALLKEEEPTKFEHASVHWPFPAAEKPITPPEEEFKFLADEKDVYPEKTESALEEWNKMIAEAEKAAEAEKTAPVEEHEEDENLDDLEESEKLAIKQWKAEHPELTVKHQRKMLEENLITELPWEQYLKAKADFSDDEAAEEAAKWAQEQIDLKKKGSELDGTSGQPTDKENQRMIPGYVQNAEQNESTIWQRVKQAKGDV